MSWLRYRPPAREVKKPKPKMPKNVKLCKYCKKPTAGLDIICMATDNYRVATWTNNVCIRCTTKLKVFERDGKPEERMKFLQTGSRTVTSSNKHTLRGLVRREIVNRIVSWQTAGRYLEVEQRELQEDIAALHRKKAEHEKVRAAKNARIKELLEKPNQSKITRGILRTYGHQVKDETKKMQRIDLSIKARHRQAGVLDNRAGAHISFTRFEEVLLPRMKLEILALLVPKVSRAFADKFLLKALPPAPPADAPTPARPATGPKSAKAQPTKTKSEHPLARVEFGGKSFTGADMDMLCWFMRARYTTSLRLTYARIRGNPVRSLADELCVMPQSQTLHTLDLSYNLISKTGAQYLAKAIQCNPVLVNINLAGNKIGPVGASALATALRHEKAAVTNLNLFMNGIDMLGASSLAEALAVNSTLKTLNIRSNNIYPEGATAIAQSLIKNSALEHLNVADNYIGRTGAQSIAGCFRVKMKELRLCFGNTKPHTTAE